MTFRVGQKVAYIGRPWSLRKFLYELRHPMPGERLKKGEVYTISNITPEGCLELVGVFSPGDEYWTDGFNPRSFRRVVERKTDISIFTAMLTPKKQGVDA